MVLRYLYIASLFSLYLSLNSCKQDKNSDIKQVPEQIETRDKDDVQPEKKEAPITEKEAPKKENSPVKSIPPKWVEINTDSSGILLDIRYATKDNFTNQQIYDCGKCFLRPEAAKKIILVQKDLKERYGFGLKIFDCYRPKPAQQKLWDIVPNPDYVTPPNKGSMHNRGLAVDLTIVDKNGKELDMGTAFDFFGKEAHHDYEGFPADIQKNRVLIKKVMELHGFSSIRTEWWHYSLPKISYPLADWEWPCE